jgi:hypothetical protein
VVVLSHAHPPYRGLADGGRLMFPRARHVMAASEWKCWTDEDQLARMSPGRALGCLTKRRQTRTSFSLTTLKGSEELNAATSGTDLDDGSGDTSRDGLHKHVGTGANVDA